MSGSTAGAAPSQYGDAPVCYKCQGAHFARDCPACWQCGSASHHHAECDAYHATARFIINIHNTCRTLAQSAARFLHSEAAEHIQELQRELGTADELVCDLFGPGPRCVKCEQDEMAEWGDARDSRHPSTVEVRYRSHKRGLAEVGGATPRMARA